MEYRICLLADLHLKLNDTLGNTTASGINSRLSKKLELLDKVIQVAKDYNCSSIVELGDTYDNINPPDNVRNLYASIVIKALNAGIEWVRIIGNHATSGHEFSGAGRDTGILNGKTLIVLDKPATVDLKQFTILYIPEIPIFEIKEFIKKEKREKNTIIFGHFSVIGAVYPNGKLEEEGIKLSSLKGIKSYLGHIHKRQTLASESVHYIGCLAKNNFSDKDAKTGCCIVTLDTDKNTITEEYIDLLDIDLIEITITENSNPVTEGIFTCNKDSIIKLIYSGSKYWYTGQEPLELKQKLIGIGASKVFVQFNPENSVDTTEKIVDNEGEFCITSLVKKKAEQDGVPIQTGLRYLEHE
jgi:DNA repair exonuclease SbcCD nuclease subunit